MNLVTIMSTYNGEPYLAAQLDSILEQSLQNDCILIRDDGSNDGSVGILQEYSAHYPQIRLITDTFGNVGIQRSYSLLFQEALALNAQFIMFADQDDVWLPEKSEKLMRAISRLDNTKPALVFSDVQVVDSNLNVISHSLQHFQKLKAEHAASVRALLFYSPAQGCSMIFNTALLKLLLPLSAGFPNPDKWALFTAAALGQVAYIPDTTLLYRQHQQNITGAMQGIHRKILSVSTRHFLQARYQTALNEARVLKQNLPMLREREKTLIDEFLKFFTAPTFVRVAYYFKFCTIPPSWPRKAGLFLSLFFRYK